MTQSREHRASPMVLSSASSSAWLDSVNSYNELDPATQACAMSTDSLDNCIAWATGNMQNGRPESPLQFDHDEVLAVSIDSCKSNSSCDDGSHGNTKQTIDRRAQKRHVRNRTYKKHVFIMINHYIPLQLYI